MQKNRLIRNKNGTFRQWIGGITKGKYTSFHGTMVHIGKEFTRQNNRPSGVGDVVRKKNKDGSYNKNAEWYVKTVYGWRRARTKNKPTKAQISKINRLSRPGRA